MIAKMLDFGLNRYSFRLLNSEIGNDRTWIRKAFEDSRRFSSP